MTARETLERMARALCEADYGFPDDPAFQGELPIYRNGRVVSLLPALNEWASGVMPMWTFYIDDARKAAVAVGLIGRDEHADFSDVARWELIKKEAKDHT